MWEIMHLITEHPSGQLYFQQDEEFDEHKVQITPPGFHIIFLPFADDFRKVNYEETPKGQ